MNNETAYELETGAVEINNRPTYWLTRFMMLRLLGLVYAVSFLVAINQALRSFGLYAVLGEVTSILAALVFLPALLMLSPASDR